MGRPWVRGSRGTLAASCQRHPPLVDPLAGGTLTLGEATGLLDTGSGDGVMSTCDILKMQLGVIGTREPKTLTDCSKLKNIERALDSNGCN